MVSQEIVEQSREIYGLTCKVMFLWNAGGSTGFIARTIADELIAEGAHDNPWQIYYKGLVSAYHVLVRKGISRWQIAQRTEDYWEYKRQPKNRAVTTMEGLKYALERTGRTITIRMNVRGLDLRNVDFHALLKDCGCVQEIAGQSILYVRGVHFKDCNFEGADLSNIDLSFADFTRCKMKGVNLSYAPEVFTKHGQYGWRMLCFRMCDARGANFTGRRVDQAYDTWFQGANLEGATFGAFNYANEYLNDERTGFSPANLSKGDYIHLERLTCGKKRSTPALRGVYAHVKLACGADPMDLAPNFWDQMRAADAVYKKEAK